jgi:Calx-beta domain
MSLVKSTHPLRSAIRAGGSSDRRKRPSTCRPRLLPLEDRTLPATFYAATVSDLIADIRAANAGGGPNSIVLTAPMTSPYVLTAVDNYADGPTGLPVIAAGNSLTIVGNGDTIERSTDPAAPNFRLLDVAGGASLTLQNLTLQNGVADGWGYWGNSAGGGLYNRGRLTLSGVTVQNNQALAVTNIFPTSGGDFNLYGPPNYVGGGAVGGGVASFGALTLLNGTQILSNYAAGGMSAGWGIETQGGAAQGGGVYVGGGTANLSDATLSGNTAQGGSVNILVDGEFGTSAPGTGGQASGGGLYVEAGTVALYRSTVAGNQAVGGWSQDDGRPGAAAGYGVGGGLYIVGGFYIVADVYSDTFTESNTINNFADFGSNIAGPYTIRNGPPVPWLTIGDVSILEGNSGTTAFGFTVNLSDPSGELVTVNYATANAAAAAAAASDYLAATGTVTFAPGETSKTITVLANGDRLGEPHETFFVNLSSATNAAIADGQGVGTILDDEPRVSIGDVTRAEGRKNQTTLFTFAVTLSAAYDQAVTVSYHTANGTATTGDGDYVARTGTLTFAPGETTKTVTIEVKGDGKREANETFTLELFGTGSNASLLDPVGLGTILNDD